MIDRTDRGRALRVALQSQFGAEQGQPPVRLVGYRLPEPPRLRQCQPLIGMPIVHRVDRATPGAELLALVADHDLLDITLISNDFREYRVGIMGLVEHDHVVEQDRIDKAHIMESQAVQVRLPFTGRRGKTSYIALIRHVALRARDSVDRGTMDPFTIIVTALVAGAAAGGQDAASAMVRDAYATLRRRISGDGTDEVATAALESNESSPGGDRAAIEAAVRRAQVSDDSEIEAMARRLLQAMPTKQVFNDLRGAQGVHSGDNGTVNIAIYNNPD